MAVVDSKTSADRAAERLRNRVLGVADSVGEFIEWWGFKSIHGRIWTLLALSSKPMSQAAVARGLGVSRALVSSAIRELEEWRLARPTHDGRNAPWVAVIDVWPTISDVLRGREWMIIESTRMALEAAIEEAQIAQDLGEELAWDLDRMQSLLRLTETAQSLLKVLVGLRTPRAAEHVGDWVRRANNVFRGLRRTD